MDPMWILDSSAKIRSLAEKLCEELSKQEQPSRGAGWTDSNFTWLRDKFLPKDLMLDYFHHKRKDHDNDDRKEFLWDFIASNPTLGIYLAMESEQSTGTESRDQDLKHDFEKLLYVFAPLRVLVCASKDEAHAALIARKLEDYANGCCRNFNPGAVFVLHCWLGNKNGSRSFLWQSRGEPLSRESEPFLFRECVRD